MRRKETEILFCRSFEQMAGASEGKDHHRKGLREEDILGREGPWRKEASQHLRQPRRKEERSSCSSVPVVPVVPVFQLISRHPHFPLITYNYLITN